MEQASRGTHSSHKATCAKLHSIIKLHKFLPGCTERQALTSQLLDHDFWDVVCPRLVSSDSSHNVLAIISKSKLPAEVKAHAGHFQVYALKELRAKR